jgi:hypothetical protein
MYRFDAAGSARHAAQVTGHGGSGTEPFTNVVAVKADVHCASAIRPASVRHQAARGTRFRVVNPGDFSTVIV